MLFIYAIFMLIIGCIIGFFIILTSIVLHGIVSVFVDYIILKKKYLKEKEGTVYSSLFFFSYGLFILLVGFILFEKFMPDFSGLKLNFFDKDIWFIYFGVVFSLVISLQLLRIYIFTKNINVLYLFLIFRILIWLTLSYLVSAWSLIFFGEVLYVYFYQKFRTSHTEVLSGVDISEK